MSDLNPTPGESEASSQASSQPETPKKDFKRRGAGKSSLTGNLAWTVLRQGGVAIIQIVVLIVISHNLSKAELGWATNVTTVTYLAQLLAWMGVAPAMIQRPELTDEHLSTGFFASIASGAVQTLGMMIFAGPLARFMGTPEVEPYFRVTSLVFIFMAFSRIATAIIERELRFHKTAKAELISSYVWGLTTIGLTYLGWHVWAISAGFLAQALSKTIYLAAGEKIPPFRYNHAAYKDLMSVGRGFSIATVLGYIASNADNFVVSRWMGAASLGSYSRAFMLMARPAGLLAKSINLVLYPTMAKSQDDPDKLLDLYRKTTTAIALLVMPVGFVSSVLAPELIGTLLGAKWLDTAMVPFQILAVGMYFRVGNLPSDSMTLAVGKTYGRVMPKAVLAISVFVLAYIGHFWGLIGVSWGILFANAVHTFLMAAICLKYVKMSWFQFLKAHQAPLAVGLIVSGLTWLVVNTLRGMHLHSGAILAVGAIVALLSGAALLKFGGELLLGDVMVEIRGAMGKKLRRKLGGKKPQTA